MSTEPFPIGSTPGPPTGPIGSGFPVAPGGQSLGQTALLGVAHPPATEPTVGPPPAFPASPPAFPASPPLASPTDTRFGSAPPLIPPTGPSTGQPSGPGPRSSGARTAAIGAVVGALVSSLVGGVLYLTVGRSERVVVRERAANATRPARVISGPSLDIQALLAKVRPSVVSIQTDVRLRTSTAEAAGSGIVLDDAGLVLTNAHVVEGATSIRVAFADGSSHDADLVGSFPERDVALVRAKVDAATEPADLGSSDDLVVGDDVVAIGNALNLGAQPSVTKGIVSAKDRSIAAQGKQLEDLIQTDAAINPGNSGGPLVNAAGQVVGVNTAIIQDSQNVGFSLSIDSIRPLIEDIKAGKGTIDGNSAFLGVSTTDIGEQPPDVLDQAKVDTERGAFVAGIQPGTAAEKAGLREGDVITAIDGTPIDTKEDVGAIIRKLDPGTEIVIEYQRQGATDTTTVELGKRGG